MAIEFICNLMNYYPSNNDIKNTVNKNNDINKIKAYHEAGHFFIAKKLGFSIKDVNIIEKNNIGGQVVLDIPNILKASQLKNIIMVKYAGFLAEKLLNDEASDGCLNGDNSDMESSNILLKRYIILTEDSISFTGYEGEFIKNKSIELSCLWKNEVKHILSENKNEIIEIANTLLEKQKIT